MSQVKFSQEEKKKIMAVKLSYKNSKMFLHCQSCLGPFLNSAEHAKMSPREAMNYEVSSCPFKYPDGMVANIIVVWCKRCGRSVWDSRHMTHLF